MFTQNETKKWYFGYGTGLDFNTNPPSILANSSMSVVEGCSSIADNSGNLLFYTDGITVYTSSHTVMANGTGLLGNNSPSQSSIIIKKPGSTVQYYIFTVQGYNGSSGLNYSIVDMSLAAGQGSVIVKNSNLYSGYLCEKITATRHCNGTDFWVVVRDYNYNNSNWNGNWNFRSYLLSATGVNTTAVVSPFTYTWTGSFNNAWYTGVIGCMKISPTGKKLACANYNYWNNTTWTGNAGTFELYDFNMSTGVVSNSLAIMIPTTTSNNWNNYGYGVEFSPDGTKLYGSLINNFSSSYGNLFEWDLCASSASAIVASQTVINTYSTTNNWMASLQLAPNGKIYCANWWSNNSGNAISVINNPNAYGAACNFSWAVQSVSPGVSYYGLPNFMGTSFLQHPSPPAFTHTVSNSFGCQTAAFSASVIQNFTQISCSALGYSITGLQWNFGDPASGAANTSTLINPMHAYTSLGTYTAQLVINYSCGGGTDTIRQTINVNQPCITVNSTSITCAHLGSATVQATGGIGPYSYTWMPSGQANSVAVGLSPGVYTLTVYDFGNNFTYTATTLFTSLIPLIGNLSSSSSVSCHGAATGTAAYTNIAGGSTLQIYSWTNGINTYSSTNSYINTLSAGLWSATVTDALTGCTINDLILLVQPPALTLNVAASAASVCAGGSVNLIANAQGGTPNYNYAWVSGPASSSCTVSQSLAGLYIYTITSLDNYSCAISNTVSVDFVPNPTLNISNVSICPLQTATLNVVGAGNYTWSPGISSLSVSGSSFTVSPTNSQFYSVIGESLSCTSVDSGYVYIKPVPNPVFYSNSPVCEGKPLVFSANSGTAYVWSGPNSFSASSSNATINPVTLAAGGVYNVTVTAANSCTAGTSGTVQIKPLPTVFISPAQQSLCVNLQTVSLNASGTATLFNWSPNQFISQTNSSGVLVYPSSTKVYTVMGSLNACTTIATATVFVVPPPNLSIALSSNSTCAQALNGSPNTITLTAMGATNYTLATSVLFNNVNPAGPISPVSLAAPYVFNGPSTATLYGSNGVCTLSTTAVFTIVPNPSVAINNPTPVICAGQSFTYTNSGASSYTWSSATSGSTLYTSGNIAVANPSVNSVFSVYGGSLGCNSAIENTTITVNPLPQVSISPQNTFVCLGNSTSLTANGNGTSFLWSPVQSLNFNSGQSVLASPVKQETYTVVASLNNCTNSAMATVSVMQLPKPIIKSNKTEFCLNESLLLDAEGAIYYNWQSPNKLLYSGKSLQILLSNVGFSGTFSLQVIDSNACKAFTTINVAVKNLPAGYLSALNEERCVPFCSDFKFISNPQSPTEVTGFKWKVNDATVSSNSVFSTCFKKPGTYTIKGDLQAANGCANSIVYNIRANPKPQADFSFSPDKPIENKDEVIFTVAQNGITQWEWSLMGDNNQAQTISNDNFTKLFSSEGPYPVALMVSNEFNCKDTIVKGVNVYPELLVFVPNAFSPNQDKTNDSFFPVLHAVSSFQFQVFDRWGEKLFETNSPNTGWDGTFKGQACKQDVYVWKLYVKGASNGNDAKDVMEKHYNGEVLLLR